MSHRIAVASSDGKYVNMHFAQAEGFYIYDIEGSAYEFVGVRKKTAIPFHDEKEFDRTLLVLGDCSAIFASRIGYGAAVYLTAKGIRIFEAPYAIDAVLKKITSEKIL